MFQIVYKIVNDKSPLSKLIWLNLLFATKKILVVLRGDVLLVT